MVEQVHLHANADIQAPATAGSLAGSAPALNPSPPRSPDMDGRHGEGRTWQIRLASDSTAGRFEFVDGIRGIAAVGIACYHIHRYGPVAEAANALLPNLVQAMLNYAWIGVQCFFVIAGFLAAHSLLRTRHTSTLMGNFALRRLVRLGFPYWTIILIVLGLNQFAIQVLGDESLSGAMTWRRAIAQFLFVQDIFGLGNVSAGLWFVAIDIQFGLLFIILVGLSQWLSGHHSLDNWAPGAVLLAFIAPLGLLSAFYFNLDPDNDAYIYYFFHMPALGALAWLALDRQVPRGAFWVYAIAMLASLVVRWRLEIVVATFAGVTLYLAGCGEGLRNYLASRPFQYLGRISYSLFLVHYPVSWLVVYLGYHLTGTDAAAAIGWLVLALVASLGAAHAFFLLVEAPANRFSQWLKRLA